MKKQLYIVILIGVICASCSFFSKEENGIPVARVNDTFLYLDDVKDVVPEGTPENDSILLLNNFIERWARQQLLIDKAQINLPEEKQKDFENLVNQYRADLYTKAYLEALVKQKIDTSVSQTEAEEVYNRNIESFKLNEELIKFRYINIAESNTQLNEISTRFKRFNKEDKRILDSIAIQFRSYSLNDSIWIKVNQVIETVPTIKPELKEELLKKSNFVQLKDSLSLYLMQIEDVLLRNETAPMEYVMPTIRQIVINKRKLEFIKELEKDITKDAIKNKQFEIYK